MCRGEDILEVSSFLFVNVELPPGRLYDPPQSGGVLAAPVDLQLAAGEPQPLHHVGREPRSPRAQHSELPKGKRILFRKNRLFSIKGVFGHLKGET